MSSRSFSLLLTAFALLFCLPQLIHAQTKIEAAPRFAPQPDGSWKVAGDGYTAILTKQGYLTSFKVGAVETVGSPFTVDPDGGLASTEVTRLGDTLTAKMVGKQTIPISYTFLTDGLVITPTYGNFGRFRFEASPALQGIELLNDKRAGAADALDYVPSGEVRGVPAVRASRNQVVRFHYPGFSLFARSQRWGAPYNYEGVGSIFGYDWGGEQLSGPVPFTFMIYRDRSAYSLAAPAFTPRAATVAAVYDASLPCDWTIDLGTRNLYAPLVQAGIHTLNVAWKITGIHDQPAGQGTAQIDLTAKPDVTSQIVTLKPSGSGYFQVLFRLSEPTGKMRPSSFQTRFSVVHQVSGLAALPTGPPDRGLSDYAVLGMIGAGANRESHVMREFFTDQPQTSVDWQKIDAPGHPVWMNIKGLDGLFNYASSEGKATGVNWFFQGNERPPYATPAVYEAMSFALVSRYKDRCHTWEVENEPNERYSPADYVAQCLVPFARGAHRADPTCTVMGPACVGLPDTLRFAQAIYDAGAGKSMNALSTHTYPGPGESWEQFGNLSMLADLRRLMAAHGDNAKPIWQTEQGYGWDLAPKAQVARYVVRMFLQGWRVGGILPSHQFYYYPAWHGFISMYQTGGGEAGSELSWLPHATALRIFAENTAGRQYAGDIPSPYKGITLARFNGTGDTDDVVAAWTFDFPYTLTAIAHQHNAIVGYMGSPLALAPPTAPDEITVPISGEPIYIHLPRGATFTVVDAPFGRNLAEFGAGATATASSEAPGHPASFANDGNWELWQAAGTLPGRTAWQSNKMDPSAAAPDVLQITFPAPRVLNRIIALTYLPAVSATPRDFDFQAEVNGKWVTVGSGQDEFTWTFARTFEPVMASAIRMRVSKINDGWFGDRRFMSIARGSGPKNYTDSRVLVSELEAYGPATPVTLTMTAPASPQTAVLASVPVTVSMADNPQPVDGTLNVTVPPGWTASPSSLPVHLTATEKTNFPAIQVSPPPDIATGATPIRVTLTNANGKVLDAAQTAITVAAPVEMTPQTPPAINEAAQPLAVYVHNVTSQPLSGTISAVAGGIHAAPVDFGPLVPGENSLMNLTAPGLSLSGKSAHIVYTVTASHLITQASQDLAWRGWSVIGTFPNDNGAGFDAVYAPEKSVDLKLWKPAISDSNGYVDLLPLFQPNQNVVAYAVVYVKSLAAKAALLSAGSDDGLKAWVNGKLVVSDNASRGAAPGQDQSPVTLKAGWNQILLKITQGGGGWGFYCDLLGKDGKPLSDLIYRGRPGS